MRSLRLWRREGRGRAAPSSIGVAQGLLAIVVAVLLVTTGAFTTPPAHATITNLIATDEGGDPLDESVVTITDEENLWAYVTSPSGGFIAVVPAGCEDACADVAWGKAAVPPFFAGPIPVQAAPLRPGLWKLVGIGPGGNVEIESQTFRIEVCKDFCNPATAPDPTYAKQVGTSITNSIKTICGLAAALELAKKAAELKQTYDEVVMDPSGATIGMIVVKAAYDEFGQAQLEKLTGVDKPSAVPYLPGAVGYALWALCNEMPPGLNEWLSDPPQPYETVTPPAFFDFAHLDTSPLADPNGSLRAVKALDRVNGYLVAGTTGWERFQAALAAGVGAAAFQHAQANAVADDFTGVRAFAEHAATELDTIASALIADGTFADSVTQPELDTNLKPLIQRIHDSGFSASEITSFHALGLTDGEITQLRNQLGSVDDSLSPTSSFLSDLSALSSALRGASSAFDEFATEAAAYAGRTNQPPLASFTASPTSGAAPLEVTFTNTSTSPDLDPLTVTWDFGDGGTATGDSVKHTYVGGGTYFATLTASDGLEERSATKTISVSGGANHNPTAADDVLTTTQENAGSVNVLANDSDPDGDVLSVSAHSGATHGTVSCDPGGVCTYTPNGGFTGGDSFAYTASDGHGGAATASVQVTVFAAGNHPPVVVGETLGMIAGQSGPVDVLANDGDPDGDPLAVAAYTQALHGTVTCPVLTFGNGTCTYTPALGFAGSDSFDYTVTDGQGGFAPGTVEINVVPNPVNHNPVAANYATSTYSGTPDKLYVLLNSYDPDGDPLTVISFTNGAGGTVSCLPTGDCTYTSSLSFVGPDSYTYTVSDGRGGTATGTVSVDVLDIPPNVQPDAVSTLMNTPVTLDVLANDSDGNGDALTVATATNGQHGFVICSLIGSCTFAPENGFFGVDNFTYIVTDGRGEYVGGVVTVTVERPAVDGLPVAHDDVMTDVEGATVHADVVGNDSDPDFDPLKAAAGTQPAHGTLHCADNECSYTPAPHYTGPDSFTYLADDGFGGTSVGHVTVDVRATPLHTQAEINSAVEKGVAYLDATQNENGSFGINYPPAETGLAIVAYSILDRGDPANLTPEMQDHLRRAVSWLLSQQAPNGSWPPFDTYDTGIALEALSLTGPIDPGVAPAIAAGRAFLLANQQAPPSVTGNPASPDCSTEPGSPTAYYCGGWNYDTDPGRSDESNTGFALTGLKLSGGVPSAAAAVNIGWQRHVQQLLATNELASRNDGGGSYQAGINDGDFSSNANNTGSLLLGLGYDGVPAADPSVAAAIVFGKDVLAEYELMRDTFRKQIWHFGQEEDGICVFGGTCNWDQSSDGGYHYSLWALTKGLGQYIAPDLTDGSNWYSRVVDLLLSSQKPDGSWDQDGRDDATVIGATSFAVSSLALVGAQHTLTVARSGTGSGTVTSDDGGISCGSTCSAAYSDGTSVTLHATAAAGSKFVEWTGACTGSAACVVTITGDRSVTVRFELANRAPLANDLTVTTDQDTPVGVTLTASDPDGNPLTFTTASTPAHGSLSGTAPNLTYTPNAGFFGTDSFTFKANDGLLDSNTATVSITVRKVNHAPVASNGSVATDQGVAVGVTLVASDPDGDALSYAIVSGPAHGVLTGSGASRTYTPAAGYSGPDSFTFKANDGLLDSNTATVSITVRKVNHAPVASDGSAATDQDTPVGLTLMASDPDGDALSYAIVSGPAHGVLTGSGASRTYTPAAGYSGSDSFIFKANDGLLDSNTATVSITVRKVNHAPVASGGSAATDQGVPVGVTLTASDADGDPLTFTIVSGPAHGTLTGSGALRTYTPAAGYSGPDSFTFKANDGLLDSNTATVSITVRKVNHAPVASDGSAATGQDTPVGITLVASDPDGDVLTFTVVSGPSHGTLTGSGGSRTYTPATGYTGPDSFTFKANDGLLDSNVATVSITVRAVDNAPLASDGSIATDQDTPVGLTLMASDPDGDALSYAIVSGPSHGTLTGSGPSRTYTPAAGYSGPDSFTFKANDGLLDSNTATVSITVRKVNHAPVASDGSAATDQDTPVGITLVASDADGDPLTFTVVSGPSHGTLTGSDASRTYTPAAGYSGPDSFTFKANDGLLDSNTATVSITVRKVNHAPVASDGSVATSTGVAVAVDLVASDPDGDALTYAIVIGPAHGTLTGAGASRTYTPAAGYSGPDSFTFKASDGHLDSNMATVSITVRRVNHAPVANDGTAVTDQNTPVGITLAASDPDSDALSYAIVSGPGHGALSGSGASRTYTPAAGYTGPDSFTFKASDGQLDSNVATVSITVRPTASGCAICIVGSLSATNLVSSGSGSIRAVDGSILINGETRVVGDTTVAAPAIGVDGPLPSGGNWSPQPLALGAPVADPLASLPVPAVTGACQSIDIGSTESVTLEPGVYCSITGSGKSRIVLDPGLYVVTDGIRLTGNSSLTGTAVTVYLASPRGASVTFTGDTAVTLTAPTSGPFRGVALFFERTSGGSLSLSQNAAMTVEGAVYGRSASLELNGTPSLTTRGGPIVVAELRRVGNATVSATLAG